MERAEVRGQQIEGPSYEEVDAAVERLQQGVADNRDQLRRSSSRARRLRRKDVVVQIERPNHQEVIELHRAGLLKINQEKAEVREAIKPRQGDNETTVTI